MDGSPQTPARWLLACLLPLAGQVAAGAGPEATFFEESVRPILVARCYECHSESAGKKKGGLWLDRKAGWMTGGDGGPAIVPHDLEASHFIRAIRYADPEMQMPPDSRLPREEIQILERWIASGAFDPRDEAMVAATGTAAPDPAESRAKWPYAPLQARGWSIDRHLDAALAEAGMSAASSASPRERLRRLFHDLTGLPPRAEDVERFAADPSEEAWARWVDDLLSRPGFGATWGRHWLDVARYADSNGGDRNYTFYQAWRYRDYVIKAYRDDKPFHRLVREQIAGDLLPWKDDTERADQLTATTFLALGPKMLTERDKEKLRLDVVDEQLDTIGRAFLGLTLGCARCHDHKFDPIPTADYYAMAGILRSTEVVLGTRNGCVNVASWVEQPLPGAPPEVREKVDRMELAMQLAVERLFQERAGGGVAIGAFRGLVLDDRHAEVTGSWAEVKPQSHPGIGPGYRQAAGGSGRLVFRGSVPENGEYEVRLAYAPGEDRAQRVAVAVGALEIHQVWVDQRKVPRVGGVFEPLGRFRFEKGGDATVTILADGTGSPVLVDAVQFIAVADVAGEATALDGGDGEANGDLHRMNRGQLVKEIEAAIKELRDTELTMAPRDVPEPEDLAIRVRGVVSQEGPVVPRGFLRVLGSGTEQRTVPADQSGRRQLAEWLTAEDNALLDRVYANRVWHHLMGQGLVRTVDNFGALGDAPVLPALLDDLADRFRRSGGSTKALVREIVLSRAYQRGGAAPAALREADPDNRWFGWRDARRLTAEELRDGLLHLTGELEPGSPGPTATPLGIDLDGNLGWEKKRYRSVYLPVARNNPSNDLGVFDAADPDVVSGARPVTNVPTQALFLLNAPFVAERAKVLAGLASAAEGDPDGRVSWLYRHVLQRQAAPPERSRATAFCQELVADGVPENEALTRFAHVLVASTEFQFLD